MNASPCAYIIANMICLHVHLVSVVYMYSVNFISCPVSCFYYLFTKAISQRRVVMFDFDVAQLLKSSSSLQTPP